MRVKLPIGNIVRRKFSSQILNLTNHDFLKLRKK